MRPQSHRMTETKHENSQTMDTKDTCFREKSFIFSFRDFEGHFVIWIIRMGYKK